MMLSIIPTGPQMNTSRSEMSGTSSVRWRGESRSRALGRSVVTDDVVDAHPRCDAIESSSPANTMSSAAATR